MEDERIVELLFARDQSALAEVERKYGGWCRAVAGNILTDPEDAKECVNDALMNLWRSVPPERPKSLKAFLGSLTRCAGLKRYRDSRAEKRGGGETALALEELSECVPSGSTPEREAEARELGRAVNDFVMSLKTDERNVFISRYWYLQPVGAISRRFGFSESKVKSMLHRTRKKLKERLIREGIYDGK